VSEVADRLVELTLGEPVSRAGDMGGPEVRTATDLARAYARAAGKHRAVLPVRLPGKAAKAFRDGLHLAPGHAVGKITWEEFLARRFPEMAR
jgi:uncharacterized protein YbjT (DUF2867 family)